MALIDLKSLQSYLNPLKLSLINSTASLLGKSLNRTAQNAFAKASRGFRDASAALHSKPSLAKGVQSTSLAASINQAYHLELNSSLHATSTATMNKAGNTTHTAVIYNAQGRDTSNLYGSTNQFTTKQVSGTQPSYTQETQLNQTKSAFAQTDTTVNRNAYSTQFNFLTKTSDGYETQSNAISTSNQTTGKDTEQNTSTRTVVDTAIKDAQGNLVKASYSDRQVDQAVQQQSSQNIQTYGTRDVNSDVSSSKIQVGNTTFTNTNVATTDVRSTLQSVNTAIDTQSQTTTTSFNRAGEVIGEQTANRAADYDASQITNTAQTITSDRNVLTVKSGQYTVTRDQSLVNDQLSQSTTAQASNTAQTLDAQGNVIGSATTGTRSATNTQQQSVTAANQLIQQGPDGAVGYGSVNQTTVTDTNTLIETNGPTGTTNRVIERDITRDSQRDWSGSIGVTTQEDGAKAYSLASMDVSRANVVDVTKEAQNQLKITTDTNTSKEIQGNISYKPAEVQPVANIGASVGISFGTYTGLASSFKLDTGEVNFNLSFAGAEVTEQETAKNGQVTAQNEQGQITNANLEGKLVSSVNDDGSRTIQVTASYTKEGDKYVIANGERAGVATGEADSTIEVAGTITLSKDGNVKSMSSDFDLYKVSNASAEGTSESAVRQALDQSDPLRKSFSFENGVFKFQLGFASLNFAVYA